MSKNRYEKQGEETRRKGEPRPKEPWFPTDQDKRSANDRKIGWDNENARRSNKAKK